MEAWNPVLDTALRAIVIPLILYGGVLLRAWITAQTAKLKLEAGSAEAIMVNEYIDTVNDIILTAVLSVQQTFVDALKEEGTWTREKAEEALWMAKDKVLEQLTEDGKLLLAKALADYEQWIYDKIESTVQDLK
jgi:hypothetical protein